MVASVRAVAVDEAGTDAVEVAVEHAVLARVQPQPLDFTLAEFVEQAQVDVLRALRMNAEINAAFADVSAKRRVRAGCEPAHHVGSNIIRASTRRLSAGICGGYA